jgi:predicted transcriptional regulator
MVKQVFSGRSAELVAYLVDQQSLTLDEINDIQTRLEQKKRELNKC